MSIDDDNDVFRDNTIHDQNVKIKQLKTLGNQLNLLANIVLILGTDDTIIDTIRSGCLGKVNFIFIVKARIIWHLLIFVETNVKITKKDILNRESKSVKIRK